jgi:hypothetical protein
VRALLGPLNPREHAAVVGDLDGLDVRCFDRAHADLAFDPATEPLAALWERLPAGWRPDCLVWWSPEYALLPEGLEGCPVPSIAVLGDWNLGLWSTAPLLEAFDLVLTDRGGVQALGAQLGVPVERWPAFSFDPRLHRPRPERPRDIDLLFVGNMNPEVQAERGPWLARLARLGRRHRVVLTGGVWGEAYAELLARARIVWNRSIRGELNMRAYEAAAAGALLLMEADNLEVRDVFADGVSCALYDEASLEAVIERYLGDPAALARVAEAGRRRVQEETYRRHLEALLDRARGLAPGARPFAALPAWRRHYWLGVHALAVPAPGRTAAAAAQLGRSLAVSPAPAALAPALAALALAVATQADAGACRGALATASRLLLGAVAAEPEDVVARMALAWLQRLGGAGAAAHANLVIALEQLEAGVAFPVDRLPLPFAFDRFRVEWERAALAPGLEERRQALRPLLAARAAAERARLEEAQASPAAAVERWVESVRAHAGIDGNLAGLAAALERAGEGAAASLALARVLEMDPFDRGARLAATRLAAARGDHDELARLREGARDLAAAVPACAGLPAEVEAAAAAPAGLEVAAP